MLAVMRLLALLLLIPGLNAADAPTAPAQQELKVMTFNLRFADEVMPHAWSVHRRR